MHRDITNFSSSGLRRSHNSFIALETSGNTYKHPLMALVLDSQLERKLTIHNLSLASDAPQMTLFRGAA